MSNYYRTRSRLDRGYAVYLPGQLVDLALLPQAKIDRLLQVGAIAPISAPPLVRLPGWKTRGRRLGEMTALEFVNNDATRISELLGAKLSVVSSWQDEVKSFLAGATNGQGG